MSGLAALYDEMSRENKDLKDIIQRLSDENERLRAMVQTLQTAPQTPNKVTRKKKEKVVQSKSESGNVWTVLDIIDNRPTIYYLASNIKPEKALKCWGEGEKIQERDFWDVTFGMLNAPASMEFYIAMGQLYLDLCHQAMVEPVSVVDALDIGPEDVIGDLDDVIGGLRVLGTLRAQSSRAAKA